MKIRGENMPYLPQPQNTDDIELGSDLLELVEALAEDVHEQWAAARMRDGWRYGPARDDRNKLHPCLVPYGELPESEKEYDRISAVSTLKLIRKFGFDIVKKSR